MRDANAAFNQKQEEKKLDDVLKCGVNRGPHDYIPIAWSSYFAESEKITKEVVTHFMCRVCFRRVSYDRIRELFPQ